MSAKIKRARQRRISRKLVARLHGDAEQMIRRMPAQARTGDTRYSFAALGVIAAYLGREIQPGKADPFFRFELNESGGLSGRALGRVRSIAVALFTLRKLRCFEDFHRRLMTRDLAGVFWECFWAHALAQDGYKIVAVKESNVRGQDFDFTAIKDGRRLCIEVTALTAPEFNEKTIYNALNTKRSQLPKNKPGIIICVLPEGWFNTAGAHSSLSRCCARLFGASERVNAVVFASEHYRPVDGQPGRTLHQFPIIRHFHDRPRFPLDLADKFLQPDAIIEGTIPHTATIDEGQRTFDRMHTRPFYTWVDSLLDIADPVGAE